MVGLSRHDASLRQKGSAYPSFTGNNLNLNFSFVAFRFVSSALHSQNEFNQPFILCLKSLFVTLLVCPRSTVSDMMSTYCQTRHINTCVDVSGSFFHVNESQSSMFSPLIMTSSVSLIVNLHLS